MFIVIGGLEKCDELILGSWGLVLFKFALVKYDMGSVSNVHRRAIYEKVSISF
jgi:hypothetical protein